MKLCTYCLQYGHTAAHCKRRYALRLGAVVAAAVAAVLAGCNLPPL